MYVFDDEDKLAAVWPGYDCDEQYVSAVEKVELQRARAQRYFGFP
jgi:hypothetical protein